VRRNLPGRAGGRRSWGKNINHDQGQHREIIDQRFAEYSRLLLPGICLSNPMHREDSSCSTPRNRMSASDVIPSSWIAAAYLTCSFPPAPSRLTIWVDGSGLRIVCCASKSLWEFSLTGRVNSGGSNYRIYYRQGAPTASGLPERSSGSRRKRPAFALLERSPLPDRRWNSYPPALGSATDPY
jgi:hypothetical protein